MAALIRFLQLDQAVSFSLLLKLLQAIAALVGIVLISHHFSAEVQGFYYTFASLVALQSFVELGLYLVISNTASHEWSKLSISANGEIQGDRVALSRLVSLGRFVFKWYAVAAIIFCVFAGLGGYWFLGQSSSTTVDWQLPWILNIFFASLLLWCMPFFSLLEGCSQVGQVAKFKFWHTLAASIAFFGVILLGGALWAAPTMAMVSVLSGTYYLIVTKRNFFRPFFTPPASNLISWRNEILPMQWRLALQGLVNYFLFAMMTPVMFYHHGSAVAGQMGMSQQIVMAMMSVSMVWITTKNPRFGGLVANRNFLQLDHEWRNACLISFAVMVFGLMTIMALLLLFNQMQWEPYNRLLPPISFLLLAGGAIFAICIQFFAMYLRAHKKEVLTKMGLISGLLTGLLTWKFGAAYGATGAAASYFLVMCIVSFPMSLYIWKKSRDEWHR